MRPLRRGSPLPAALRDERSRRSQRRLAAGELALHRMLDELETVEVDVAPELLVNTADELRTGDAYDRFMGRYSRELAPVFADFAGRRGQRVLPTSVVAQAS